MHISPKNTSGKDDSSLSTFLELSDVENFHILRNKHSNNLFIRYLNVNSLRNKIINLRKIVKYLGLNYFVVIETKLDVRFPSQQFVIEDFETRDKKDRLHLQNT